MKPIVTLLARRATHIKENLTQWFHVLELYIIKSQTLLLDNKNPHSVFCHRNCDKM